MPSRRLAVAAALFAGLATPPAAGAAPTLAPLAPCYVSASPEQRETVRLEAGGFTPNALVNVTVDGEVVGGVPVQADPSGAFVGDVRAPYQRRGERAFTVSLAESGDTGNAVTAESRVTALGVAVRPRQAAPRSRVRFRGRGFTRSGPVYAHYVFRGRVRRTVRMGRARGTCGTFSARRRQIPVRPRHGTWRVQFDQLRRFTDPPESVFVQLEIQVFPTSVTAK